MSDVLTHAAFDAPDYVGADGATAEEAPDPAAAPGYDDGDGPAPEGKALARALAKALEGRGWQVPHRWSTPYSHAFEARRGKRRYDVMVEHLASPDTEWLVTAVPRAGLMTRVFGGGVDANEHRKLALDLHSALDGDGHVTNLRWYTRDDWGDHEPGTGGAATP